MTKAKSADTQEMIKLTLLKSLSKRKASHIACAHGLGLRKIGQTTEVISTPENWGMVKQIPYLVRVEEQ